MVRSYHQRKETLLSRFIVLGLGVIIAIVALARPGLIVPISTAGTAVCISSHLYPLIGATLWKRPGKVATYGAIITAATSLVTWLVWKFPLGIFNVLWGLIIGGIVFIILAFTTPSPQRRSRKNSMNYQLRYSVSKVYNDKSPHNMRCFS